MSKSHLPKMVAIVGPTASGKTDISLELAKKCSGYVICADSRTMYQEMNIGTAKPYIGRIAHESASWRTNGSRMWEIEGIAHYGLDIINPTEQYSAAQFQKYVKRITHEYATNNSRINHAIPFLVGGSGLYIAAVVDNLAFPAAPPDEQFRAQQETKPLETLRQALIDFDPEAERVIDTNNKRRVIRALEIMHQTGIPISQQRTKNKPPFDVLILGITRPRQELYARINQRIDAMMQQGFLEEFETLYQTYGCAVPGMSGIGYHQFCLWKQKAISLDQAIEKFKQGDRNLAKRQMTWFGRDSRIHWVDSANTATHLIQSWLC